MFLSFYLFSYFRGRFSKQDHMVARGAIGFLRHVIRFLRRVIGFLRRVIRFFRKRPQIFPDGFLRVSALQTRLQTLRFGSSDPGLRKRSGPAVGAACGRLPECPTETLLASWRRPCGGAPSQQAPHPFGSRQAARGQVCCRVMRAPPEFFALAFPKQIHILHRVAGKNGG